MAFLDGRVQFLFLAAAHAKNEVGKMIAFGMTVWSGLFVAAKPGCITPGIFVAGGEIPFRTIKNVADRVMRAEVAFHSRHQASPADSCLVVGDPVSDFELHHLTFTVGKVKFKRAV